MFIGCPSQLDTFAEGRIEQLCDASLPICDTRVTCVLTEDTFLNGVFPGAERALIYLPHPRTTITVKFLIEDFIAPGTEMLVRAYQIGCVEVSEKRLLDVDIFERAGDDRVLSMTFELEGEGDHLIEWFSDATAIYSLAVDYKIRDSE